jgi:uncharacterized protein (DUF1499 family)
MKNKIIYLVLFLLALFTGNLFRQGIQSSEMLNMKTYDGSKLGTCPDKPNCVSSFEKIEADNYIEPSMISKLDFSLSSLDLSDFNIVEQSENYIYMTYKSSIFKFVDDIELLYTPEDKLLHFRSASRVGYSDMGANRKRVQKIKSQLR